MLIVIDESIGFDPASFSSKEEGHMIVKPAKPKKKGQNFEEYVEAQSSPVFPKSIRLLSYSIEEEIEFFAKLFRDVRAVSIIYFYDPFYTEYPVIRRVQNVFQPDKKLYALPVAVNRAETAFIVDKLIHEIGSVTEALTYQQLRELIKSWIAGATGWVLTPNVKSLFKAKTFHKSYRKSKKDTMYLKVRIESSGKLKTDQKGMLDVIGRDMIRQLDNRKAWIVMKGADVPDMDGFRICTLHDKAFPINIPYVQVFEPAGESESTH